MPAGSNKTLPFVIPAKNVSMILVSVVELAVAAEYACFLNNRIIVSPDERLFFLTVLEGLCDHVTAV